MEINTFCPEVESGEKIKVKKDVYMSLDDFVKEHKELIRILKEGSRDELLKEAKKQSEELEDETREDNE